MMNVYRGENGMSMLPLIKRAFEKEDGRARRDRGLALPARQSGTWLRPDNFEPGCEVLVPRVHANGNTKGHSDQTTDVPPNSNPYRHANSNTNGNTHKWQPRLRLHKQQQ